MGDSSGTEEGKEMTYSGGTVSASAVLANYPPLSRFATAPPLYFREEKVMKNIKCVDGKWIVDYSEKIPGAFVDRTDAKGRIRRVAKLRRVRVAFATKTEAQNHLAVVVGRKAGKALGIEVPAATKPVDVLLADFAETVISQQTEVRPKTLSDQRNSLKALMRSPLFKDKTLSQVTTEAIALYHAERGTNHKSSANSELCLLKLVLRKAVEWGKLDRNPADTVKPYRSELTRLRILTDEEAELLLNAATPQLVPVLRLLLTTAMRPHEVFNLYWANDGWENEKKLTTAILSLEKKRIFIPGDLAKNGKDRWVSLSADLVRMFRGLSRIEGAAKVFPYKNCPYGFGAAVRAAGLKNVTLYTLKHTACSTMIADGTDIVTVSEIVGHADIKMTARYCHSCDKSKLDAVERISRHYFKDAPVVDRPAEPSEARQEARQTAN